MIDPHTPIEKLSETCRSPEDLRDILTQCDLPESSEENFEMPPALLQEAMEKTAHLKTVTTSDIQKCLRIAYPLAAKICTEINKK